MKEKLAQIKDLRSRGILLINSEMHSKWTKGQDMLEEADRLTRELTDDFYLWMSESGYHADDDGPDAIFWWSEQNELTESEEEFLLKLI